MSGQRLESLGWYNKLNIFVSSITSLHLLVPCKQGLLHWNFQNYLEQKVLKEQRLIIFSANFTRNVEHVLFEILFTLRLILHVILGRWWGPSKDI